MKSVVLDLQNEALDKNVRVSDLLRKALVVACKLGLSDFQAWIERELNGYSIDDDTPDYRNVNGQIRGWNPARGWIPLIFEDPKMAEKLSRRKTSQSIAELEHIVDSDDDIHMPFPQDLQKRLSKGFGFQTEVSLFSSTTAIVRIIDAVRTIVLNWALKLEEKGILGEGLSFTAEEKEAAGESPQHVTNFYGPVHSPQIQQGTSQSMQVAVSFKVDLGRVEEFVGQLRSAFASLKLPEAASGEAKAELATIDAQLSSPNPKPSIVRECLSSIRKILEGAGGGAAAHLLVELGKALL